MARKRMIDPDFWDDPEVGAEHSDLRLLYEGIWTQADDEGRLLYDVKRLHRLVFGYRKSVSIKRTEILLSRLIDPLKKLVPYSVNGKDYLFAKNFLAYQKLSHPTPSKLPPPPENSGELQKTLEDASPNEVKVVKDSLIKNNDVVIPQQSEALLASFPLDIQPLVTEYVEIAKRENKTQTITDGKKLRLINELFNLLNVSDQKQFTKALEITVNNEAPNLNYVKKVMKNLEKKVRVGYKHQEQEWKDAREKSKRAIKETRKEIEEMAKPRIIRPDSELVSTKNILGKMGYKIEK